jgi:hypothetical protein
LVSIPMRCSKRWVFQRCRSTSCGLKVLYEMNAPRSEINGSISGAANPYPVLLPPPDL